MLSRIGLLDLEDPSYEEVLERIWTIDNTNSRRAAIIAVRLVLQMKIKIPKSIPRRYVLPVPLFVIVRLPETSNVDGFDWLELSLGTTLPLSEPPQPETVAKSPAAMRLEGLRIMVGLLWHVIEAPQMLLRVCRFRVIFQTLLTGATAD